jgi:hypothetical protein
LSRLKLKLRGGGGEREKRWYLCRGRSMFLRVTTAFNTWNQANSLPFDKVKRSSASISYC